MPSLNMKTRVITCSSKEKYGLQVCRKSSMISKNPSGVSIVQHVPENGTCPLDSQDASVHGELFPELGLDDINRRKFSCEESLIQKQLPIATNSGMEPTPSTCTVSIDTISSFILKSMDVCDNGGSDNLYVPLFDWGDSDDGCRNSCELSEFFISDLIFSGPEIGDNPVINNKINTPFSCDHEFQESSICCDFTEECMMLPSLENCLDTGCVRDDVLSEETMTESGNSILCSVVRELNSYDHKPHISNYHNPDQEGFDPLMCIRNFPDELEMSSKFLFSTVQNEKQTIKPITLVLDLDETLVHSSLECCDDADFTFHVYFDMKEHTVYVRKRPHLQIFLERVAEMFEIVVFAASQSIYAEQLLNILDPCGKLISRRAYRESCILLEGIYTKDLTVLGVDLAKVAIIDNSPQVFRLQVNNGIPIKSWFDDMSDNALISLIPFLETLIDADDVRPIIAKKFSDKE